MLGMTLCILTLVLHSSLSHEVLHGHPFPSRLASEALVLVSPGLFVPYFRFRDTHLAHHLDARLTDPYDDPESNYLDPCIWDGLPKWMRMVLQWNNTLLGRMCVGPAISQYVFMRNDLQAIRSGQLDVLWAWLVHIAGCGAVIGLVAFSKMPILVYVICAYLALSVLKIRTFLEHQAHASVRGRTVVIEDRGILAFLFLNNNFHIVHHMHPRVAWFRLPALYRANRDRYLSCNCGYVYRTYGQIFRQYFLRSKDPVAHPLWPSK